jgi:CHAT domain-containing protein
LRAREEPIKLLPAQIQLLLVSEGRAKSKDLPVLVSVDKECEEIMQVAKSDCIPVIDHMIGDTTVSRVLQGLSSANIVHLACHGIQDTQDAVESGFCLGDGNLTLSDLMDTDLDHAFLAFLSACETAKGDEKQPDQTVHLAAAMLFAGFRSVIATMWCV